MLKLSVCLKIQNWVLQDRYLIPYMMYVFVLSKLSSLKTYVLRKNYKTTLIMAPFHYKTSKKGVYLTDTKLLLTYKAVVKTNKPLFKPHMHIPIPNFLFLEKISLSLKTRL